jgi:hypothetical protein
MPKAQYAVFRAPGDWTAAEYDEYDGPELGKKFKDYARRKVGVRGAQAETVFTRKVVAAAAPAAPVVEVEAGDNEEDAVMAALTAGMAGMSTGGEAMQEGGRRGRKSRKAGRKGASRRKSHKKSHRKSRRQH